MLLRTPVDTQETLEREVRRMRSRSVVAENRSSQLGRTGRENPTSADQDQSCDVAWQASVENRDRSCRLLVRGSQRWTAMR